MKDHAWVSYGNPKNQRIRLCACKECGTLKDKANVNQRCCKSENVLEKLGWQLLEIEEEVPNKDLQIAV